MANIPLNILTNYQNSDKTRAPNLLSSEAIGLFVYSSFFV